MKFTLAWLKEHLDSDAGLDTIAETLTSIGLEVEGIEDPAARLAPFTIARVLTAERHPQADKLQVLTIDAGNGVPQQVVCGAANARAGLIGVFAAPGAYVPGSDLTLKVAAIRGVESRGMMCSMRELELSDEHDGIIELPADAPLGASYAGWAGLDDPVIEVAITPNRQDCMGVRGIARDLAAAGIGSLKALAMPLIETAPAPVAEVRTEDPEGCPAFYGQAVDGVTNGASPEWMQRRLRAIGQRPISALVDITNYVMIDLGRPLHVYDRARLNGGLVARKAKPGETVTALNGKRYALDPSMTVIADNTAVHDIGGIMGGEHSGVGETTTEVIIECAFFDPAAIARTGQTLALTSDARQRFERGVDPSFLEDGLAIATGLVLQICGGRAGPPTHAGTPPLETRTIAFSPDKVEDLGGMIVDEMRQKYILDRLGFAIEPNWTVTVPSWRRDVEGPADLVEEIIRIEGLDQLPSIPLPRHAGVAQPTATDEQRAERRLRRAAAARGLNEAITWSFIAADEAAAFGGGAWMLENPISSDLATMRPSLLPGLLAAVRRNLDRGASSIRLFEIGRRYLADGEHPTLGLVLAGEAQRRGWRTGNGRTFDAFDVKADAIALLAATGAPVDRLQLRMPASPVYHPGRSGQLRLGPKLLAEFGEIHPATARTLDMKGAVAFAEIFLDAIPLRRSASHERPAYVPPALQPVTRDFAFLVPLDAPAETLLRAIAGADKTAIVGSRVFDVFTGKGVPEDMKSLAVEVVLQPSERSFTDAELKAIADRIVAAAEKIGARLRD